MALWSKWFLRYGFFLSGCQSMLVLGLVRSNWESQNEYGYQQLTVNDGL